MPTENFPFIWPQTCKYHVTSNFNDVIVSHLFVDSTLSVKIILTKHAMQHAHVHIAWQAIHQQQPYAGESTRTLHWEIWCCKVHESTLYNRQNMGSNVMDGWMHP